MVIAEAEIVDRFQMKSVIVFVKIRSVHLNRKWTLSRLLPTAPRVNTAGTTRLRPSRARVDSGAELEVPSRLRANYGHKLTYAENAGGFHRDHELKWSSPIRAAIQGLPRAV
jgi:hypothetical protein